MMIPGFVTIIVIECHKYDRKKIHPKCHRCVFFCSVKEVLRTQILKFLEVGIIDPIAGSRWVSPLHCISKRGGITVVPNDKDELILQRIVTGYRMLIDYRKLNKATRKDHYPLPFIDQMLERLSKHTHFLLS